MDLDSNHLKQGCKYVKMELQENEGDVTQMA